MKYIITTLFVFATMAMTAQTKRCFTDEYEAILLEQNPHIKKKKAEYEQQLLNSNTNLHKASSTQYNIPVVFHVLYKTNQQNLSDQRIYEQLNRLNEDFAGENSDTSTVPLEFKPFIGSANIHFYLATLDPDGNVTNGINKVNTTKDIFTASSNSIKKTADGGVDAWNPNKYLNIWVGNLDLNILGYSTSPFNHGNSMDGIVLGYKYVGNSTFASAYSGGRTAVHEVGHYFGLQHVWGSGSGGCSADDGVADTPLQEGASTGTPVHPRPSCGSNDMFMNYLDYCDDIVSVMFTHGQVDKMYSTITTFRSSLLSPDVSVNDIEIESNIFPNPSRGLFEINLLETPTEIEVRVLDITGKTYEIDYTVADKRINVNADHLTNGIYFIELKTKDKRKLHKVIVSK